MKSNEEEATQQTIRQESMREMNVISVHLNRLRSLANKNTDSNLKEIIQSHLFKNKLLIDMILQEID